ncbi:hypothetical protein AHiyo1_28950 [Arthrobacter sp. Hiyo1]|nr:hypothetical protein AHiyo1_28950 [Arthrobacter sp. Hiyo1]
MPPTTGGNTRGRRTKARRSRCPRKGRRARTRAKGIPKTTQSAVLAAEVRRLRPNAVSEESEVTSGMNCAQLTFATMAASGNRTNKPPTTARPYTHRGIPLKFICAYGTPGLASPGLSGRPRRLVCAAWIHPRTAAVPLRCGGGYP